MPYNEERQASDELLDVELSDDELRQVLERLGRSEFGGEGSRVRDVVEATQADPQVIGRLLADIRKESFEEKYGLKIEDHEARIEKLEDRREQPAPYRWADHTDFQAKDDDPLAELEEADRNELLNMVEERRLNRKISCIAVPFVIVVAIVGIVTQGMREHAFTSPARTNPTSESVTYGAPISPVVRPSAVDLNGVTIYGFPNGPWMAKDHGKTRSATSSEVSKAKRIWASTDVSKLR